MASSGTAKSGHVGKVETVFCKQKYLTSRLRDVVIVNVGVIIENTVLGLRDALIVQRTT